MSAIELSFTNGSLDGEGGFTTMRRPVDWPCFPASATSASWPFPSGHAWSPWSAETSTGRLRVVLKRSADAYLRFLSRFSGT